MRSMGGCIAVLKAKLEEQLKQIPAAGDSTSNIATYLVSYSKGLSKVNNAVRVELFQLKMPGTFEFDLLFFTLILVILSISRPCPIFCRWSLSNVTDILVVVIGMCVWRR